jgi:hypothetical protein
MACIGQTNTIAKELAAPATRQMDLKANGGNDETRQMLSFPLLPS